MRAPSSASKPGPAARAPSRSRLAYLVVPAVAWLGPAGFFLPTLGAHGQDGRLGEAERSELEDLRRRGKHEERIATLEEILAEEPDLVEGHVLLARSQLAQADYARAEEEARAALSAAEEADQGANGVAAARVLAETLVELGRAGEALAVLEGARFPLKPVEDARDAWAIGRAALESGRRDQAFTAFQQGAASAGEKTWEVLFDRARCQRALGFFERAAQTLVSADKLAGGAGGVEPDVLVELGRLYFEVYGEVDDPVSRAHSPAELYREALEIDPAHEGALLGLFALYRFNWQRVNDSPADFLEKALAARPSSVPALLAQTASAIDDGDLPVARAALERLAELAPRRRDVRTERAALAWVEKGPEESGAILAELVAEDGRDARPEREVGAHLIELYRFAEALGVLEKSVERDRGDWSAWMYLGRAQANTGDEEEARKSLAKAVEVGQGRRDAWRDNTLLVLERMSSTMVEHEAGSLRFLWPPDEGPVLEAYLPTFYGEAREELAARYGFTPGKVLIEVFRRWKDFSVRSTGFEGYPALGVCFGPVVTAVSPLCELRGTFSWARTSYHEFTHVIHLGLSHNRCPRWITEGLATWEEGTRRAAWWRNMRRELLDARANDEIIPVRRLNNAFRGPRVLFAYYQSGLLCRMLIEQHGFPPMVRLLQAFDRGLDLDRSFEEIFGKSPEEIDADFTQFVDGELTGLAIEPRWTRENTFRQRFRLSRQLPEQEADRAGWADQWCRVAWGSYGQGELVAAQEALRLAELAGDLPPRGSFLRGEIALAHGDDVDAMASFRRGFERGGEDYRARMALGTLLLQKGETDAAEQEFRAAEKAFPGFADPRFSAELELAGLHEQAGDHEAANQARMRWLDYNSGDYPVRVQVAEWLDGLGRHGESVRFWEEANEVDPFRRHLHYGWGRALAALGRHEEALREFDAGLAIQIALDGDVQMAASEQLSRDEVLELTGLTTEELEGLSPQEVQQKIVEALRARYEAEGSGDGSKSVWLGRFHAEEPLLHGHRALELLELGRKDEARAAVEKALALDTDCEPALAARSRLE